MAVLGRAVGEDRVVACREREGCGLGLTCFTRSWGGPLGGREGVCSQPASSQSPEQASKPTVTWATSFPLPGHETWRKPNTLAKTRTPANHTFTLPTASQGAGAEGPSLGLLPPMDALRQTAPCLQSAACPGLSQLKLIITWGLHGCQTSSQGSDTSEAESREGKVVL